MVILPVVLARVAWVLQIQHVAIAFLSNVGARPPSVLSKTLVVEGSGIECLFESGGIEDACGLAIEIAKLGHFRR